MTATYANTFTNILKTTAGYHYLCPILLPSWQNFPYPAAFFISNAYAGFLLFKKKTASESPFLETRTFRLHRNRRIASGDSDVFRTAPAVCIINTVRCLALYFETALRCFKKVAECAAFRSRYRIYPALSFLLPEWYFYSSSFPHCAYIRLHYNPVLSWFFLLFSDMHHRKSPPASSRQTFQRYTFQCVMVFVAVHTCMTSNGILPILRISNRQNPQPELYRTEFSVQKIPACEQLLVFRFRSSICFFFGFIRAN